MVEEKNEAPVKEGTPKKKSSILIFVIIAVLVVAFFAVKGNYDDIQNYFNPPPETHNLTASDVELYKFSDLSNNKSVNVEVWVVNLGEQSATNIMMHVRVRSENGTMRFNGNITLSTLVLRQNETGTGDYTIWYASNASVERHLFHTIEIVWDDGRHTYSRETY